MAQKFQCEISATDRLKAYRCPKAAVAGLPWGLGKDFSPTPTAAPDGDGDGSDDPEDGRPEEPVDSERSAY